MPSRFRYCFDPVFLISLALYLTNRFLLKPNLVLSHHTTLFTWYLNDLLCIPVCLPPCLLVYRMLRLRRPNFQPTRFEILSHLVVWSVWFEWFAPTFLHRQFPMAVADPWDVVAYAIGAAIAGAVWGTWGRGQARYLCHQTVPSAYASPGFSKAEH